MTRSEVLKTADWWHRETKEYHGILFMVHFAMFRFVVLHLEKESQRWNIAHKKKKRIKDLKYWQRGNYIGFSVNNDISKKLSLAVKKSQVYWTDEGFNFILICKMIMNLENPSLAGELVIEKFINTVFFWWTFIKKLTVILCDILHLKNGLRKKTMIGSFRTVLLPSYEPSWNLYFNLMKFVSIANGSLFKITTFVYNYAQLITNAVPVKTWNMV